MSESQEEQELALDPAGSQSNGEQSEEMQLTAQAIEVAND